MKKDFHDSASLLAYAGSIGLRTALLQQVERDYQRAGLHYEPIFTNEESAQQRSDAEILQEWKIVIYRLLMERFDGYLNLMYAADVPETTFKEIRPEDPVAAATEILFIFLRREWQKVWYRARASGENPDQK